MIGGSSDRSLYIYDLDRRERTLRLEAHADDINSVAFADEGAQLILTGSDDCLIKACLKRFACAVTYIVVRFGIGGCFARVVSAPRNAGVLVCLVVIQKVSLTSTHEATAATLSRMARTK